MTSVVNSDVSGWGTSGAVSLSPTEGNLILLFGANRSGNTSPDDPAGFTKIWQQDNTNPTHRISAALYYKVAGVSDGPYALTWGSGTIPCTTLGVQISAPESTSLLASASNDSGLTANQTTVATGTASGVSGDVSKFVFLAIKKASANPSGLAVSWGSETFNSGEAIVNEEGTNRIDLAFDYADETSAGPTEASTADISGSTNDSNTTLLAGIAVFGDGGGGGSAAPQAIHYLRMMQG